VLFLGKLLTLGEICEFLFLRCLKETFLSNEGKQGCDKLLLQETMDKTGSIPLTLV
jgi:hypothetical protein